MVQIYLCIVYVTRYKVYSHGTQKAFSLAKGGLYVRYIQFFFVFREMKLFMCGFGYNKLATVLTRKITVRANLHHNQ